MAISAGWVCAACGVTFTLGAALFRDSPIPSAARNTAVVNGVAQSVADSAPDIELRIDRERAMLKADMEREIRGQVEREYERRARAERANLPLPIAAMAPQPPLRVETPLPQPAAHSSIDIMRQDAAARFGTRFEILSRIAEKKAANYSRYDAACRGKVTKTRPVASPGIPLDRTLIGSGALVSLGQLPVGGFVPAVLETKNETTPECRILWSDITMQSKAIEQELRAIDEEARRGGIYPGLIRDLHTAYGLDRWR